MVVTTQRGFLRPSVRQGLARGPSLSDRPQDWPGLLALWIPEMGPPGGTTLRDWSGRGHHATLTNMAPASDWVVDAEHGYALDYEGTAGGADDVVDTNYFFNEIDRIGLTIVTWVNPRTDGGDDEGRIVAKAVTDFPFQLAISLTNWQFRTETSVAQVTLNSAANTASINRWTNVVGWYDGANMVILRDGQELATVGQTGSIATSNHNVVIGNISVGGARQWDGLIGQVRLYNRALAYPHLKEIYEDPFGIVRPRRQVWGIAAAAAPAAGPPVGILKLMGVGR